MPIFDTLYTYSANIVPPPIAGQVRGDTSDLAALTMWHLHAITDNGTDLRTVLLALQIGDRLLLQDQNDSTAFVDSTVSAATIDQGVYVDVPVTVTATGSVLKNNQRMIVYFIRAPGEPTPPTPDPVPSIASWRWPVWSCTRGSNPVMTTTVPPAIEPLTLVQAKLAAGLDWADGDPRDAQMQGFLTTSRRKVESDAEVALLTQTRLIQYDAVPAVLQLPVKPLQTVQIAIRGLSGTTAVLDPSSYQVDQAGGRIAFLTTPVGGDAWQPWQITVVAGWTSPEEIPAELVHLVGLLTAHCATLGRDLALLDQALPVPYGYDELIAPWRPQVLV